jgi:deazaflavin-dependent oxidoreductase (nitroreductase family)
MTTESRVIKAPAVIRIARPLGRLLLRLGVPMGPDALMTIRGRRSGSPRTVAVAVVSIDGRRWVIGAYGNVNWVHNLRAAQQAVIHGGRRRERVSAAEVRRDEAEAFYRDLLPSYLAGLPVVLRLLTIALLRSGSPDIIDNPARAARTRPIFELVHLSD